MEESIDCAKKFFENDPDEPLLGMTTFANYFVKEFDCDAMVRDAMKYSIGLVIYEGLTENKEKPNERQSFFKGFQKAAHDFTKYEK